MRNDTAAAEKAKQKPKFDTDKTTWRMYVNKNTQEGRKKEEQDKTRQDKTRRQERPKRLI